MPTLLSAWPAVALVLPALWLLSCVYFLVRGDRRAVLHLLALFACFVIGALLMEFFLFMGARMAGSSGPTALPVLGTGTRQLVQTMANPRSLEAPPLSIAAVAAYSLCLAYAWVLVTWAMHLRGGPASGGRKKKKASGGARRVARA